jgi:hypothetical protein
MQEVTGSTPVFSTNPAPVMCGIFIFIWNWEINLRHQEFINGKMV